MLVIAPLGPSVVVEQLQNMIVSRCLSSTCLLSFLFRMFDKIGSIDTYFPKDRYAKTIIIRPEVLFVSTLKKWNMPWIATLHNN